MLSAQVRGAGPRFSRWAMSGHSGRDHKMKKPPKGGFIKNLRRSSRSSSNLASLRLPITSKAELPLADCFTLVGTSTGSRRCGSPSKGRQRANTGSRASTNCQKRSRPWAASQFKSMIADQVDINAVFDFRRCAMTPRPQKPRIIIAHVEGSGTALIGVLKSSVMLGSGLFGSPSKPI